MRNILLVLLLVAACGERQDGDTTERTRCEQLRDHLVELRLADAIEVDKDAHREAMRASLGEDFMTKCSRLRDDVVDCAIGAPDSPAAAACTR